MAFVSPLPRPVTLPRKCQGSSDVAETRPSCQTGSDKQLQQEATVDTALVFPKAMAQDGLFLPLHTFKKKGYVFCMSREAFYTVLCNTSLQKNMFLLERLEL